MYGANPLLFNYGPYGQTVIFWRNVSETYVDIRTPKDCAREVFFVSETNDIDIYVTLNLGRNVRELYSKLHPIIG
jgi:hypothetical protein